MNLDSIEFQEISDGFDISVIPTEREDRVHGYMRLKPSATKEAATAENETVNIFRFFFSFLAQLNLMFSLFYPCSSSSYLVEKLF